MLQAPFPIIRFDRFSINPQKPISTILAALHPNITFEPISEDTPFNPSESITLSLLRDSRKFSLQISPTDKFGFHAVASNKCYATKINGRVGATGLGLCTLSHSSKNTESLLTATLKAIRTSVVLATGHGLRYVGPYAPADPTLQDPKTLVGALPPRPECFIEVRQSNLAELQAKLKEAEDELEREDAYFVSLKKTTRVDLNPTIKALESGIVKVNEAGELIYVGGFATPDSGLVTPQEMEMTYPEKPPMEKPAKDAERLNPLQERLREFELRELEEERQSLAQAAATTTSTSPPLRDDAFVTPVTLKPVYGHHKTIRLPATVSGQCYHYHPTPPPAVDPIAYPRRGPSLFGAVGEVVGFEECLFPSEVMEPRFLTYDCQCPLPLT